MCIAERIKEVAVSATAFSPSLGVAIANSGRRVHFPQGSQEIERRNKEGRVTMFRYRYADNSTLEMVLNEPGQVRWSVKS